jgi:hypothetical protein
LPAVAKRLNKLQYCGLVNPEPVEKKVAASDQEIVVALNEY